MTQTAEKSSTSSQTDKAQEKADKAATEFRNEVIIEVPGRTIVKTAEDAVQQYLRGMISEEDMRAVCAAHGVSSIQMPPRGIEAPDTAFEIKLPEDMVERPTEAEDVSIKIERVQQKAEVREAAAKAADKVEARAEPEVKLEELQNREANKAGEKVEEKQEDPAEKSK